MAVFSLLLYSCRTDESIEESQSHPENDKIEAFSKFESHLPLVNLLGKSASDYVSYHEPFKEIIQNFMKNNPEYAERFQREAGEIYFDLRSFTYGETTIGLAYPIMKDGTVNAVLIAMVNEQRDWVTFIVLKNSSPEVTAMISKFQKFYDEPAAARGKEQMQEEQIEEVVIVVYQSIPGPSYIYYQPYTDYGSSGGLGLGMSGGPTIHQGGGFYNPAQNPPNPCEKTKSKISDPKFKAKYQELNKPEMFAMDHEKGFYERLAPVGSNLPSGFPVVDGAPCTHGLDFPDNEDGVAGLMHTHNDNDCDGNPSVKIFSPKDVRTFLNKLIKQARIYTGSYTNGYSTVITSQGSYMLQYTNDTWPGSTWDKIDDWNAWYVDKFERLTQDELSNPSLVEKIFTQFLEEKVGIDGLEVYKITENSSSKLEYNGANQPVVSTPCPQ